MVGFSLGNDGKHVNEEYHLKRQQAKRNTYTIDEWGPQDIENYDLETVNFGDGSNKQYYIVSRPLKGEVEEKPWWDLRELNTHD